MENFSLLQKTIVHTVAFLSWQWRKKLSHLLLKIKKQFAVTKQSAFRILLSSQKAI